MRHRRLVVLALIVGALTLLVVQGGAAAHKQPAHANEAAREEGRGRR